VLDFSWVEIGLIDEDQSARLSYCSSNEGLVNLSIEHHILSHGISRPYLWLPPGIPEMLAHDSAYLPGVNLYVAFLSICHNSVSNVIESYVLSFESLESRFDFLNL